jgi:hypothetical protein
MGRGSPSCPVTRLCNRRSVMVAPSPLLGEKFVASRVLAASHSERDQACNGADCAAGVVGAPNS